jgi:U3 small nucleolar RNA-associated protein 12
MDGSIRLWDAATGELKVTFQGHKAAVTTIAWDHTGSKLASGSRDSEIILWDILTETGLYRLRGHTNTVLGLLFVNDGGSLISCSKDTFVKVWDLTTQHCIETVLIHRSDVIAISLINETNQLVSFSCDHQVRVFDFKVENISRIISDTEANLDELKVLDLVDTVDRSSKERILAVANWKEFYAVLSSDRRLEIFKKNIQ